MNQATVSKMERRTDMYVSTMRRFVRAMGGELEIRARFPEGVVEIDQFGAIPKMPSTAPEQGTDAPAEDEGPAVTGAAGPPPTPRRSPSRPKA